MRSIQLSDPHIDFFYQEGSPSECGYPICCRDNGPDEFIKSTSRLAGKWGDYNCDIPHTTLKHMLDFIAENQDTLKTDFITWTGDNSAHNVWDNTEEEITRYTVNITDTIKESLKNTDIDIFPIEGNHDTWPVNVQDFSSPNSNYAINHFVSSWTDKNWLSEEEATLFQEYGYYSKPFKFNPKGKVIGLNMQACNNMNWWLLDNRVDPGHQIDWLEKELLQIEKDGGFAYMIGHIPPHSCLHQFGIRYKVLMERFQHIVRFSSFGHSHNESIFLTMAINTTQPIGFNFITGSGTSGGDKNPAFTVIDFDAEYMVPLNTHTYFMNLTTANANPDATPEWHELHDFVKEYGLKDLSPSSIKEFTERMYNNSDLASLYEWNSNRRGGEPSVKPHAKEHNIKYLCLQTSEAFEEKDCKNEPHINLKSLDLTSFFEYFIGDWIEIK